MREVVCLETGDKWMYSDHLTAYQALSNLMKSPELRVNKSVDCFPVINKTESGNTLWFYFFGKTYAILNNTKGDSVFQDMPEGVNLGFSVEWDTGSINCNIPVLFSDISAKSFTTLMRLCRQHSTEDERERLIRCLESEIAERGIILSIGNEEQQKYNAKRLIGWEGFPIYDSRYPGQKVISYEWYCPVQACHRQIKNLRKAVDKLKKESWGQTRSRKKSKTR